METLPSSFIFWAYTSIAGMGLLASTSLLSYICQFVHRFIIDGEFRIYNWTLIQIAKLYGVKFNDGILVKVSSNGVSLYNEGDVLFDSMVYMIAISGIITMLKFIPEFSVALILAVVAIFSARFVYRLKTKIEKLGEEK